MNILYVADIHGPKVTSFRGINRNLSMAGTQKVLSIAAGLQSIGYNVEIFSNGSVAEKNFKIYKKYEELVEFDKSQILIKYGMTVDMKIIRTIINIISGIIFIIKKIINQKLDAIIVYNLTTLNILIIGISRLFQIKVYLAYEDSAINTRQSSFVNYKLIFKIYELLASRYIDGGWFVSQELKTRFEKLNISGPIINGVLGPDILKKSIRHCEDNKQKLTMIYCGGLDASKGIDIFIDAYEKTNLNHELIICGSGPDASHIKNKISKSKKKISFLGTVSRETLLNLIASADIGINPHRSDLHSGGTFPFKIIEYLGLCGAVFSNRTNCEQGDIDKYVYWYNADTVDSLKTEIELFFEHHANHYLKESNARIEKVKNYYGYKNIASFIEKEIIRKNNSAIR